MNDEAELYTPIIYGAKAHGFELYRIADGTAGLKPFDIGGVAPDGRAVAIEAKFCKSKTQKKFHGTGEAMIPWNVFQPQQIAWLKCFARKGGMAIVYIYFAAEKLHAAFLMDEHEIGCTLPVPYTTLFEMKVGYNNAVQIMGWEKLLAVCPRYPTPNHAIHGT